MKKSQRSNPFKPSVTIIVAASKLSIALGRIDLEETNPDTTNDDDTTKQTHPTIRLGDGRLLARGALRECAIRRALRGQRHSAEGGRTRKSHRGDQRGAHSGATHLEEDAKAGREGTRHFRDCFEEARPQLCDSPRLLYARLKRHLALQFYSLFQILCVGSLGLAAMAEARRR